MCSVNAGKIGNILVVVLAAYFFSGCNVLQMSEGQMERRFTKEGLSENFAQLETATVDYWVGGIGPTLLLVHGFVGLPMNQWAKQIETLIGKYRLIIPNLLWFGDSYSEVRDYSIDHQVQTLVELLNYLAADKVHVVGLGYGGFVAYELAAAHGELVESVVLVGSPGRGYTSYDYEAMCGRHGVKSIDALLLPKSPDGVKNLLGSTHLKPPKIMPGYATDSILSELNGRYREEKVNLLKWLESHLDELDQRTQEIAQPSLIIWGAEDRLCPLELGKRLADRLGDSGELFVIDQAGHCPNQEQGKLFNARLLGFLKEISDQ